MFRISGGFFVFPVVISQEKKIPIYVQIADQFKEMIHSGLFENGDTLPTRQALAKQVCVNINTINHAYRILEHEGYVVTRRGIGSFVNLKVDRKTRENATDKIRDQLMNLRAKALSMGLAPKEFNAVVRDALLHDPEPSKPKGVFIECHEAWTHPLASTLEKEINAQVKPLVMPDRRTNLKAVIDAIQSADFVITTHAHYDEVREITDSEKVIFPLDLHLSHDVLTQLSKLKEGKIAVPFLKSVTTKRLGHWIKAMGFQIDLIPIRHKDRDDLLKRIKGYENLMVPINHLKSVMEIMPGGINVIPIKSVLGQESVTHLKKELAILYPRQLSVIRGDAI